MKKSALTLLILIVCSAPLLARDNVAIQPQPVNSKTVAPIFFNQNITAVVGTDALVKDIGCQYAKTRSNPSDIANFQNNGLGIYSFLRQRYPFWYNGLALVVINGMRIRDGALIDVQPSTIKSLRFLKGASASIYGPGTYTGVLVINTK